MANNYAIKKNLRGSFPYPYSIEDATNFVELVSEEKLGNVFAITLASDFIGIGSLIK